MTWRPTAALVRSVVVAALGLGAGVVAGRPAVVALAAPFVALAALGLLHRPGSAPSLRARLGVRTLHEGQGTTSTLVGDLAGAEQVTRWLPPAPRIALRPPAGCVGAVDAAPVIEVGARRWGRVMLPVEQVALISPWGGFRWGPVPLDTGSLLVLPARTPYDARASVPHPHGLVGAHRSRRTGDGTEYAATRPFRAGDRLRRINWRETARTRALSVDTTLAEEDAGVLLVVDALVDIGSGESSLDRAVRAAAAIAEHHVRRGDRVGVRVVSAEGGWLAPGAGQRHLRRLLGVLATVRPGTPRPLTPQLGVTAGTIVVVLSPMLAPELGTLVASLARRGVTVLVVDTLPPAPAAQGSAALAWRLRLLERDEVLARLAWVGCPVVAWRGPGSLDEVLTRLARQAPGVRA